MTRKRILRAAFELFSTDDYDSVSLADIAERVGIKKPSIYAHFSGKEELFLSVLDTGMLRVSQYIDEEYERIKRGTAEFILYEYLKAVIKYSVNNPMSMNFMQHILYSPPLALKKKINLRINSFDEKTNDIKKEMLEHGIRSGDIKNGNFEILLYSFNTLIRGNIIMVMSDRTFTFEKLDFNWQIYWNGIKK